MTDKHEKTKLILKIVGIIMAVAGLGLTIAGFINMYQSFGNTEFPDLFWLIMLGIPLLAIGVFLTMMGFRREISAYVKNESTPVINELGQEITPAVSAIAGAVKNSGEKDVLCACGKTNPAGSKFCKYCGKPLTAVCPHCGANIDADGKFCNNCGKAV